MNEIEEWRPVRGFDGMYEVSNLGGVRSLPRYCSRGVRPVPGRILSRSTVTGGYLAAPLTREGKCSTRLIHQLVLEAFVGPRPPGMEACHGNGKRDDNRLANLRWDTKAGNHADRYLHGTSNQGSRHGNTELSEDNVREMRAAVQAGVHVRDIAATHGLTVSGTRKIINGESWAHADGKVGRPARHGNATLTVEQVRAIRVAISDGIRNADIARQFGIGQSAIGRIKRGISWNDAM